MTRQHERLATVTPNDFVMLDQIWLTAQTKLKQIAKNDFKQLRARFKQKNIEFDRDGLTKYYSIKRPNVHSVQQLKSDLEQFTEILIKENFEPEK